MTSFKISLKPNEKIYLNGAVVRFDRKTSMEILNDVDFLLENHVLQATEATTPLRQLYFVIQLMLMAPQDTASAEQIYDRFMPSMLKSFDSEVIVSELKTIDALVQQKSFYEAMRSLRNLFATEDQIMQRGVDRGPMPLAAAG